MSSACLSTSLLLWTQVRRKQRLMAAHRADLVYGVQDSRVGVHPPSPTPPPLVPRPSCALDDRYKRSGGRMNPPTDSNALYLPTLPSSNLAAGDNFLREAVNTRCYNKARNVTRETAPSDRAFGEVEG